MSTDEQEHIMETEPAIDDVSAALRTVLAAEPYTLLDALIVVFQLARDTAERPKDKYHTVVVPDGVDAIAITVDSFDEFLAVWRSAYAQRVAQIFGFYKNELISPSEGGDCMVTSWGSFPLLVKDRDIKANPKGYLGPLPTIQKPAPAPAATDPINNGDEDIVAEDHDDDVVDEDDESEE